MKTILSIFLLQFALFTFGQNPSNTLNGLYKNSAKNSLYSTLNFDGNGKVTVSEMDAYDFFERNDSVVILVDRIPFVLKKNKSNILKGVGDWIDGESFKSTEKSFTYNQMTPANIQRAKWVANHYDINYKNILDYAFDENIGFDQLNKNLIIKNESACNEGFDLACIQVFSLKLIENMGGFSQIVNSDSIKNIKAQPDDDLEKLGQKIITLGNAEGYGLLANYYMFLGNEEKFKYYKDLGLENGCKLCFNLEINSLVEEIEGGE